MFDLTGVTHHPAIEEIVDVLCNKTQNTDRGFFRIEVAYFLGKVAANMRANIVTKDRGEIPVNIYALALATSGFGKGHSVHIMEDQFLAPYKKRFIDETMPVIAEKNLWDIASERAMLAGTDQNDEFEKAKSAYNRTGEFAFTFDSGSIPAVKQLREQLLYAACGAINLQIDEIGSNLIGSTEVLNVFLELYDQGIVKQKLKMNTAEQKRSKEIDGKTPTNALLFGTPTKLLDGGQTEDSFYTFLETGYARRCLFGFGKQNPQSFNTMDAAEIYQRLIQSTNNNSVQKWADHFYNLADPTKYNWKSYVDDAVGIKLLEYKIDCERQAALMPQHDEIRKAEISHRYFKALKLAGALAFIDQSTDVTMSHLMSSILLVEENGISFQSILTRERNYVKLANYIADVGTEVTHADLLEALPFYKSSNSARNEMMALAIAWGYKQHIVIKKTFTDGIEFFKGEKLKETNLDNLIISHSNHWAYHYQPDNAPFDKLHLLTQEPDLHWANHTFKGQHRAEENANVGFNMVVLDIDEGISLSSAMELMKDYKYHVYTTKRHTDEANRFRMILPIKYHLELDSEDYKEFMENILLWLPFKTDESANQRSRKWSCFAGSYDYNMEGELLDPLPFIPKTTKNEQFKQHTQEIQSMDNLERWFAQRIATGNRNSTMLKFALTLVDSGMELHDVKAHVFAFNYKLKDKLPDDEIHNTIMVTVAKQYI